MTDKITKEKRSWNMSRIRSKNTKPEMEVRKALWSRNLRYRINYQISGKPDIAFPKKKIAVFVNGCFWHRHGCKKSAIPKSNTEFWIKKLKKNTERDKENIKKLKEEGWETIILWECEINKDISSRIDEIAVLYNERKQ